MVMNLHFSLVSIKETNVMLTMIYLGYGISVSTPSITFIIVITLIVVCILVVLGMFIGVWLYAQKYRNQKRARLQGSLIWNEEVREMSV